MDTAVKLRVSSTLFDGGNETDWWHSPVVFDRIRRS